ncbi:MAG: ribonuclease III [Gammaproteobacteria bacterium]
MPATPSRSGLCAALGYDFVDENLLTEALTHRSAGRSHNERLEFLGDAVLDLIVTEQLYRQFPEADEGQLTRTRARLVKGESLAAIARHIELGAHVSLGDGEMKSGGWRRDSILANTLEAIIGAVFLDAGLEHARDLIIRLLGERLTSVKPAAVSKDPKTTLQEYLQGCGAALPAYETVSVSGPSHDQQFTVSCRTELFADAVAANGSSRRKAEQAAARHMLEKIGLENQ